MATNKLIGEKYTTPDLVAKVTGKARYAEDWRVDGMLFCKLLTSPYPHAKVTKLDTSKALALAGGRDAGGGAAGWEGGHPGGRAGGGPGRPGGGARGGGRGRRGSAA